MDTTIPKEYWEEIFSDPDPWRYFSSAYERSKYRRQIALVADRITPNRILEIGCAEGAHTLLLAEAFPEASITALDHCEAALDRAEEHIKDAGLVNVELLAIDGVELLRNSHSSWDLIVWSESLRHFGQNMSAAGLSRLFELLGKHLANHGILCMANKAAQLKGGRMDSGSSERRALMNFYFDLLSHHVRPVHRSVYDQYKKESRTVNQYEIWLFQK